MISQIYHKLRERQIDWINTWRLCRVKDDYSAPSLSLLDVWKQHPVFWVSLDDWEQKHCITFFFTTFRLVLDSNLKRSGLSGHEENSYENIPPWFAY